MDLDLQVKPKGDEALVASYVCPCGCNPRATYARGAEPTSDGCCCGNTFAVGPDAGARLVPAPGFRIQVQDFQAPWGGGLQAAWSLGQSGAAVGASDTDHDGHGAHDHATQSATAIDPVCGMTVDVAGSLTKDLHLVHDGVDHYFCGKGCKLEFGDDPARFLDPGYVPSM